MSNNLNRLDCASRDNESLNAGQFAYRMSPESVLVPDGVCIGAGPGPGVMCSSYGALRATAAQIGDPTLMDRSYFSSGCPNPNLPDYPQMPQSSPMGDRDPYSMMSWPSRVLERRIDDSTQYAIGNRTFALSPTLVGFQSGVDSSGYQGVGTIGTNIPSRSQARTALTNLYTNAKNSGYSKNSYGSYGCADCSK